jgi:hypothetical protein
MFLISFIRLLIPLLKKWMEENNKAARLHKSDKGGFPF